MHNLRDFSKYPQYVTTALALLLPFLVIPVFWVLPVQSKMLIVSCIAAAGAGAWGYAAHRAGSFVFPRSAMIYSAIALVVVYIFSAILSGTTSSFFSGTGEQDTVTAIVLCAAVLFLAAVTFRSSAESSTELFRALFVGGLVLMIVHVAHLFVPSLTFGVLGSPTASAFGSWHEVGILAGLYIFLTVLLFESSVFSGVWRYVALALSVLSGLMLLVVNMVDVWYVFGALMIIGGAFARYRSSISMRSLVVSLVIGIMSLAGGFFAARIYDALPARLQVLQVEIRPSWAGTFAIGEAAITNPRTALLGSGPNTFTHQWSLYKPLDINATEYWNVDFNVGVGFIPTTLITVGILGLIAWCSLFALLIWQFVRRLGEATPVENTIFAVAAYLTVFHILYVPTFSLSVLTFLVLGVYASVRGMRGPFTLNIRGDFWTIARTAALAFGVLVILVASILTIRAVASDIMVNKSAAVYTSSQNTDKALSLLRSAIILNSSNDRAHRAAVELGLIKLAELASGGANTDQVRASLQVSIETAIQHGLAAVSINSADYRNWLALAGLYRDLAGAGVTGAYENAQAAYEKARSDNPNNPTPFVQMAQLDIALGRYSEAVESLDQAIALKQDFGAAYFLRSQAHAALGMQSAAEEDARTAAAIAPEDPLSWYNLGAILYDAGKYEDGAIALQQATALRIDYANALFVLGLTYDKLGRHEDALLALRGVAATNPGDTTVAEAIANIEAGKPASDARIMK